MKMKVIGTALGLSAAAAIAVLPAQAQEREWPGRAFIVQDSCTVAGPVPGGTYVGEGFFTAGATAAPQGTVNGFFSCHVDQVDGPQVDQAFQARGFPCNVFGVITFDSLTVISPSGRATVICHVKQFDLPE